MGCTRLVPAGRLALDVFMLGVADVILFPCGLLVDKFGEYNGFGSKVSLELSWVTNHICSYKPATNSLR